MAFSHADPHGSHAADASSPEGLLDAYVAAMAAQDMDALESLYETSAALVPVPGRPVTGRARTAASTYLMHLGPPLAAHLRRTYAAGDVALLVVDWSITGTGADGSAVDLAGTATDIVRRGTDGLWRYVVDNPSGAS